MKRTMVHLALASLMSFPRMGELEMEYATKEEIPEQFSSLYTERGGKFVLTGIKGMPDTGSVDRLNESLRKERNDHKATKEKFAKLHGRDLDELLQRDSEYDELKLRADKVDDAKINEIVDLRVKQKVGVVERERDTFKTQATTFEAELNTMRGKEKARAVADVVRKAASTAKVLDTAVEDVELMASRLFEVDDSGAVVARDNVGIAPGITPEMWLTDIRDRKPHWFPTNVGGGAGGSGGQGGGANNPWSEKSWNMTEQAKILKNDPEKAKRMASMHGVDPYNPVKPVKK